MSRSGTAGALPPATSATEALENVVEESRREYDKKVETIEEIDDKAMRSVRTAVILAGLVVSAVSVSGPRAVSEFTPIPIPILILVGALGIGALAVSIIYGIGTYSMTEYPTGVGSAHRNDVLTGGYDHDEWCANMIDEYDEWSEDIADEIENALPFLEVVQLSLSFGVVALLVSASMIVLNAAYGVPPSGFFMAPLVVTVAIVTRTHLRENDERLS